jgi:flagellar motor switch protein FliG
MARTSNDKLPAAPEELSTLTKAAILLMTLDTATASTLLKQIPAEAVEEVTRELAGLGRVPEALRSSVVEEFYGLSIASDFLNEGGLDYAKVLLKESLDPGAAERVLQHIQTQVQKTPSRSCRRPRARTC